MQALSLEKKLYHWLMDNPKYALRAHKSYFQNPDIALLFSLSQKFLRKYPKTPTIHQMKTIVLRAKKADILTDDKIDIIYDALNEEYDEEWYRKTAESWLSVKTLEKSITDASDYFRSQEITEDNAGMICNDTIKMINEKGLVSFKHGAGIDFLDASSYDYNELENKAAFGIPYIDKVTDGGIGPGELWVIQGQTNVGKSIWLANLAKGLMENGKNIVYVSLEMKRNKVIRRIGANCYNIPSRDFYKILEKDPEKINEWIKKYKIKCHKNLMNLGSLRIEDFPTSSLTVIDLERWLVDEVQKVLGSKIDVVLIDYINIMANWRNPNSENTYNKIKQIAEDLRGMGGRNDWGVITLTQIKKDAYGATDTSLSDTSESSGLGSTADVQFGIIQDSILKRQSKYRLKLIKNRDEGYVNSKQLFDVSYDYLRITQNEEEMILDNE